MWSGAMQMVDRNAGSTRERRGYCEALTRVLPQRAGRSQIHKARLAEYRERRVVNITGEKRAAQNEGQKQNSIPVV